MPILRVVLAEKGNVMFAGRAYREGFDQGSGDGRSGRNKRPRPSFWKGLVSGASYTAEFFRGYHAGYAQGCRTQDYARQRLGGGAGDRRHDQVPTASREERLAALDRGREPDREEERDR